MENFSAQIRSDAISDELRNYIHDDFRENESFYWKTRDSLIQEYRGKWIAIHNGQVIAVSDNIFEVTQQVGRQKCHAFITKVGREDQIVFKNRSNSLKCPALIQPLPHSEKDRLLGRDVLNQLTTIFRGTERKVIFMKSRKR